MKGNNKEYKEIKFSWENIDYLIPIKLNIEKDIYLINKNVFNHSVINKNVDNNLLKIEINEMEEVNKLDSKL